MSGRADNQEQQLQVILQNTDGWVARYLNKRISFPITRRLLKTRVTPNQITFGNLCLAGLAAFWIVSPSWGLRVAGALLMQLSSILDGCDGEVAKLKGLQSKSGAWFDTVADDVTNNLFFIALFVGLYRKSDFEIYGTLGWINVCLSAGVTAVIYHQLLTKGQSANAKDFEPTWQDPARVEKSWFDWLRPIMKRDFFILTMAIFIILDQRAVIFWMGCVATLATFLLYGGSLAKSFSAKR